MVFGSFSCTRSTLSKQKCLRIVLLGNVGSGKTTFCKQLVDSYLGGVSASMRKEFTKHIQGNVLHRLVSLKTYDTFAEALKNEAGLLSHFEVLENAAIADFDYTDIETLSYVPEVLDAAIFVGTNVVVKELAEQLYFEAPWDFMYFRSIPRIMKKDYQPSKEDIFMCRKPTTGHCEYIIKHLHVDGIGKQAKRREVWIEFVDVGGTSGERKRWENVLKDSDGIIYFISMTDYAASSGQAGKDYYAYLNPGQDANSTFSSSEDLFTRMFATRKTSRLPIVLVFTKRDLFSEMIEKKVTPATEFMIPENEENQRLDQAADNFQSTVISTAEAKLRSLQHVQLIEKMMKTPVVQMNLIRKEGFNETFKTIWERMETMMEDMKALGVPIEEAISAGKLRGFSVINRMSWLRTQSQRFLPGNRVSPTKGRVSKSKGELTAEDRENREKIKRQSGRSLLRKSSFQTRSTASELVSGNNLKAQSLNARGKRGKSTVVFQGIRRTKSYHWN